MNALLPVLGFCAGDFAQAEQLLDLIAAMRNRKPKGYILIAAAPDTHGEMHKRVEIAAKVGFEHVGMLTVGWPKEAPRSKAAQINLLMQTAFAHVDRNFKSPFVWLEPDAVPLKASWLEDLSAAYDDQQKRCMGAILTKDNISVLLRTAVFPPDAIASMKPHFDAANKAGKTWEIQAANDLAARASKTKLIQHLPYTKETPLNQVRNDAVLLHGDKEGILLARLLENGGVKKPKAAAAQK